MPQDYPAAPAIRLRRRSGFRGAARRCPMSESRRWQAAAPPQSAPASAAAACGGSGDRETASSFLASRGHDLCELQQPRTDPEPRALGGSGINLETDLAILEEEVDDAAPL